MNSSFLIVAFLCAFQQAWSYNTICYGDLGCFVDGPPYGDTNERPISHLPNDPADINVRFYLDTTTGLGRQVFHTNMEDLAQTSFDSTKPTKFIVHGFLHNGDVQFMNDMSAAFLSIGEFNIIRVDWVGGSVTINYPQSAVDTQVVGAEIGLFIQNIMANFQGSSPQDFHCIGHSLGAQACGYAGKFVSPKIARISGLDPAGPYFENTPNEVRLDSSDAVFVDVIHTDAEKLIDLGFGTNQVSGHIDFWPNDGINQPGCDQNALSTIVGVNGVADGVQNFVACNHLRAITFYTESITSKCPFTAVPCPSFEEYLNGKCLTCDSGVCPSMGYHSIDAADSIYQSSNPNNFLLTYRTSPYCEQTAYVQVTLGSRGDSIQGKLYISLYGVTSNTEQELLGKEDQEVQLRPSNTFSYLTQFQSIPLGLERVKLLWTQEEWTITNQYITIAQITVWVESAQKLFTFCGDDSTELKQEMRYSFYAC